MTYKQVRVTEEIKSISFDINGLEGNIDVVQSRLAEVEKLAGDLGYIDITLKIDHGYEGVEGLSVVGSRWETEEEFKQRVAKLKREKEKRATLKKGKESKEYEEYLRLKDKFEKQVEADIREAISKAF